MVPRWRGRESSGEEADKEPGPSLADACVGRVLHHGIAPLRTVSVVECGAQCRLWSLLGWARIGRSQGLPSEPPGRRLLRGGVVLPSVRCELGLQAGRELGLHYAVVAGPLLP